jgi:hypothetical protein
MNPAAFTDIRNSLANAALNAYSNTSSLASVGNLGRQLDAAVLNFTWANANISVLAPSADSPTDKTLTQANLALG